MLIKNPELFAKILIILFTFNQANILDEDKLIELLNEIYFQPYPEFSKQALYFRFPNFDNWKRPEGPIKIAIQVGHMLDTTPPLELKKISRTGGVLGPIKEVEINKLIGFEVKKILEEKGYFVEILPAIIPPEYYADAFVSIHANSTDTSVSGFMISTPYVDYSGKAHKLKNSIIEAYLKHTNLEFINYATVNMTHYYAFNWSKFKRAIHPKTPAVIIEMGNIQNTKDLLTLILGYKKVAEGIAEGIEKFIKENY